MTAAGQAGTDIHHPLAPVDAPVAAAQRAAAAAHKGEINGPAARVPFDAMMGAVPAAADVRTEAGMVGGVPGWWCRPAQARPGARLLFLHGGGYVLGSARAFCNFAGQFARRAGADAFIPDYRPAPEHPFPAAIDDAHAAYQGLVAGGAERIALVGDSAGGGLALSLLSMAGQDASLLQPCAASVLSPWTDLALTGPSMEDRADADPIFTRDALASMAALYLQGQDAADPRASPVRGPADGLPPVRIDVGEDEILLDDARRYAARARAAGTEVTLAVWAGMRHVFPSGIGTLHAARTALDAAGQFLAGHLHNEEHAA